jgi:hypothetical protein
LKRKACPSAAYGYSKGKPYISALPVVGIVSACFPCKVNATLRESAGSQAVIFVAGSKM